jgi:hypothetical protein
MLITGDTIKTKRLIAGISGQVLCTKLGFPEVA